MKKEFESELAKRVSGKKSSSGAWVMVVLCASLLVSGIAAVTVVTAGNGDMVRDQLKDCTGDDLSGGGSCDNDCDCVCDGVCDNDADGDGVCDNKED